MPGGMRTCPAATYRMTSRGRSVDPPKSKFSLRDRPAAGPAVPHLDVVPGDDDIARMLEGAFEVPPERWADVPRGSSVKALMKDGRFVRGGFVKNFNRETRVFTVGSGYLSDRRTFPLQLAEVEKLYKDFAYGAKIELSMLRTSVQQLSRANAALAARCDRLERMLGVAADPAGRAASVERAPSVGRAPSVERATSREPAGRKRV